MSGAGQTQCTDCLAGEYQSREGEPTCLSCAPGHVSASSASIYCSPCSTGEKSNADLTGCEKCPKGSYQTSTGKTVCLQCTENRISQSVGSVTCEACPSGYYSGAGASACSGCPEPDQINTVFTEDSVMKQKCVAETSPDEATSCFGRTIEVAYGSFTFAEMEIGASVERDCQNDEGLKATFTCHEDLEIRGVYQCKSSETTPELEAMLKDEDATPTETMEKLSVLVQNPTGTEDVKKTSEIVQNVIEKVIADGESTVSVDLAKKIIQTMVDVTNGEGSTQAGSSVVETMLVVGQALSTDAEVKKESIVLTRVSLEEPKEGTPPPKSTTISFSVRTAAVNFDDAEISRSQPEAGNFPIATMSVDADAGDSVVAIIVGPELASVMYSQDTTDNTVEGQAPTEKTKKINSVVVVFKWYDSYGEPKKNPQVTLTFQSNKSEVVTTLPDGTATMEQNKCCKWNEEEREWLPSDDLLTLSNPDSGAVLCVSKSNSSFAVLMSAYEIDRGYAEAQSMITYVLLGVSTVGLVITLLLLLPVKKLRATRSAKINICFTVSLLLASLTFLIQDLFISSDNSGVIKMKSVSCVVYAMLQHYLWLVVFCWMVIEGFLMYLSLVQVFGSHISKYMLKFNLAAWGIPIPFPFIGYFVFTKKYYVGTLEFVEHGYLAETMCFIRPESVAFYALFLAPIVLVIITNIVFFALVVKVIKNSKSSANITDHEQVLRQLKAAVGVMVLLGTGWFFGIFMSVPAPELQLGMQYIFIFLNGSQGFFVFLFYIVLNEQVKSYWLVKVGLQDEKRTTTSTGASGAAKTSVTAVSKGSSVVPVSPNDNIYDNPSAVVEEEDHTYSTAEYANGHEKDTKCEFPAKSDDNTNI